MPFGGSMTRRDDVLALAFAGLSDYEIAARLGIAKRRVRDLIRSARETGVDVPRANDRQSDDPSIRAGRGETDSPKSTNTS